MTSVPPMVGMVVCSPSPSTLTLKPSHFSIISKFSKALALEQISRSGECSYTPPLIVLLASFGLRI